MTPTHAAALDYAARGWPVFPVHTPTANGCSCRQVDCNRIGKHPRIFNGRNGATTDPEIINKWWSAWPDANVGIATGTESGLIVLDVDEYGENSLQELPDTVEAITGSGGRHLLFRYPNDGKRYRTRVRFAEGLDSRADGGYIVAPPSLHQSGRHYEWEASSEPGMVDLADAPEWFLQHIRDEPIDALATRPEWNPEGELPEHVGCMLSTIPADDYEVWRDVGMALHHADPVEGMAVWDWWSSTSPAKYNADSIRREWANFSRRGHSVANPITLASVRRMAEAHGWIDPDIEHGAQVSAILMESYQRRIAEELRQGRAVPETDAPEVMPKSGLIHDIAHFINRRSVRPQPMLAVMAATAFIGALSGRKYQTETGLRTNVYIVGLAESGAGKEAARRGIDNLCLEVGASDFLGGGRLPSGAGVVTSLVKHPSRLFMLDEFGLMLQAMTGKRADPHKRDIITTLMVLYSAAGSVYRGAEYADQKDKPRFDIVNPNACVYATSTHNTFYGALNSGQGVDGTLSRLIVASSGLHRPDRQRPDLSPCPKRLADDLKSLIAYNPGGGNLSGSTGSDVDRFAQIVTMDSAVYDAWETLDDDMTDHMTDAASRSVYSRVAENAAKLALIHAISVNHLAPKIGPESFAWGREIALWAANTMMREVSQHVADNDVEAEINKVLNLIRAGGEEGISQREVLRSVRTIRKRELEGIIQRLYETGEIIMKERKNPRGKSSMVFAINEDCGNV